ncbi:DUF2244 domain-containing protein [Notoacmeibacter sp. MSK16QG-6]|uniref:DUF2244 domain-containing protein n=1 Tax=Notoacmeibacter sp. MSK16QG-6 TaxID=2957982 RepID=UPI00209E2CED|nr:DUF2244 domain-containing protein [Notoacmeibacter sp. MSK16QG-6]MCP1198895.1 DUF2244 domain-containing protein [Notoacmeibacter sp. MSK16QG-6]
MTGNHEAFPDDATAPIFDAVLTPHRSLGRTGFLVLMALVAILWLGTGLYFLSIGAWPILGFFGLDLVILYIAFRLNYRAARAREEVTVWRHDIEVRQYAPSGRVAEHRFNPFWTRFAVERKPDIGITEMALKDQARHLPIGHFLNPDDRDSFASEFGYALAAAKGR